jgi:hypothetical protein
MSCHFSLRLQRLARRLAREHPQHFVEGLVDSVLAAAAAAVIVVIIASAVTPSVACKTHATPLVTSSIALIVVVSVVFDVKALLSSCQPL